MTKQAKDKIEALETLHKLVKPGDTIFTKLNHVAKSGMMRVIDCYVIKGNEPLRITWSVAAACGYTYNRKHEGVTAHGCGTDMGFEIVYNLGYALFPAGFSCTGEGCPSNDHANPPHPRRAPGSMHHESGGYSLRQRWL